MRKERNSWRFLEALLHNLHGFRVAVYQDEMAIEVVCRFSKRAASGKEIEHDVSRL